MPKRALLFPPSVLVVLVAMVSTAATPPSVAAFAFQPTLVPSQAGPLDVTLEDLSGDGVRDLVVTNYVANSLSVSLGNGAGGFGPRTDYPALFNPASMAVGDVNGDGIPDVVVANWGAGSISVYPGTGGGALGARTDLSAGDRPISLRLVHMNADAHLDVVLLNRNAQAIRVMPGNGAGLFAFGATYPTGIFSYSLALGHLDAGTALDAVVGQDTPGTSVAVLAGNGAGGFGAANPLAMGTTPRGVTLGDINADANPDLVSANYADSTVSVRLGNGTGGFAAKLDLATPAGPFDVAIADMDGNGTADLIVANSGAASVSLFPGDGNGGFGAREDLAAGNSPTQLAVADLDSDGSLDFAVTNQGSASVTVYLNAGPIQVPSAANSTCPTTASVGPRGTCCFDVIVRDALNNPIAGATTVIDFGGCPSPTLCPSQPPGVQIVGNTVVATTDAAGLAHFCLCVTSPVPLCNVTVSAEGVQLCSIALSSCEGSPADSCATPGWRDLTVSGPGPRTGSAMVRHETRGSLFLFGGSTGSGEPADTWEWDGEVWTHQSTGPMWGRRDHGMAYDRARDRIVLFSGAVSGAYVQETWEWGAASGWQLRSSSGPSPRSSHAMAYDENMGKVILFGGLSQAGVESDTWAWDGTSWALVSTTGPPARMSAAMASDPERKRIVLFGGSGTFDVSSVLADTWEWDGTQWTDVTVPGGPAPRRRHAMAFAPPSSRTILYGGEGATGAPDGTTWSWNGFGWRAEPSGTPTISPVLAYDYTRGLITAFGGSTSNGLRAITSQLCCLCDDEAIETDAAGEPIMPPGWDPLEPVIDEIVEEDLGDIATLYPTHDTSADTWLKDYPCPTAVGGTIPPDVFEPSVDDSLVALGIDAPGQAIVDSLASWESQLALMFGSEPDSLGLLPPIGNAYVPPAQAWCPPDSGLFVFGGRDIVFIHGLMLDHVFDRVFGNTGAKENWKYPTPTESAQSLNPEFYDTGGYYREIAKTNWNEHISAFLDARGIKNRYVIVTYSCSQRLEIGIHSVLTQIHDAMGTDAVNVVDPTHTTKQGFGTPSFVIVSHSTGGLMAAAAMHAARTYPTLQAGHIAARCKAHMGLASAFSGSRLATAALVLTGALGAAEPGWLCPLVRWAKEQEGGTVPACPFVIGTFFRSVLIDLVPSVAQLKWSGAVNDAGVKTVTLNGGHPTHLWPLKNLLHPGYDDGVVNINSACSNPNPNPLWPSGFIANWGPLGVRRTYDMGMAYYDGVRFRAKRYFQDAMLDPSPFALARLIPYYVAASPVPYLSPTGMLQSVGLEFPDATGFNPLRRRTDYYSFMTSAGEHPGIRSGEDHPDYKPTYGVFSNVEEARVIREEDLPGMRERYAMVDPLDDQPIVKEGCEPDVYESVVGRRRSFKIRVYNNKPYPKKGWIWKRHYFRPAGVLTKHISDYGYDSVLACEPIAPWCDAPVNVDEPDRLGARATTLPNPSFGRVTFSFLVPRTAYAALTIYDLRGRTVRQLVGRELVAGPHRENWDGLDDRGMRVAAGVYFWKLRTGGLETTQRLVIVR